MAHFNIREPYWKFKGVGLAENKMTDDILSVDILYKDQLGNRVHPETLYVRKNIAMLGRLHVVPRSGTRLRIVPIDKMSKEKPNA